MLIQRMALERMYFAALPSFIPLYFFPFLSVQRKRKDEMGGGDDGVGLRAIAIDKRTQSR